MKNTLSIYVDIDSLFDTRLSAISLINDDAVIDILPHYHGRDTDDFWTMSKLIGKDYHDLVKTLDPVKLLKSTKITAMLQFLIGAIDDHMRTGPSTSKVEIKLNFYGYDVEQHIKDLFAETLSDVLQADVTSVSFKPEIMQPKFYGDFNMVFMYRLKNWIESVALELAKTSIKETVFYMPAIKPSDNKLKDEQGRVIEDKELADKISKINKFDALEVLLAPFITIKTLPASFYCALPKGLLDPNNV